jgi:hypothetical protein
VRVIQRCEYSRLALETSSALGVGRELGRQDFDRDVPPELRIARAIHLTHAARAEQCLQVISAECVTAQGGGRAFRRDVCRGPERIEEPVVGHRFVQERFDLATQRFVTTATMG